MRAGENWHLEFTPELKEHWGNVLRYMVGFGVSCAGPGVGLDDPYPFQLRIL